MNFFKNIFTVLTSILLIFATLSILFMVGSFIYNKLIQVDFFAPYILVLVFIIFIIFSPIMILFTYWDFKEMRRKLK